MKAGQRHPFWPYLCVVACLFLLTIMAPKTWLRESTPPQYPVSLKPTLEMDIELQSPSTNTSDPLPLPPVARQLTLADTVEPLFLDELPHPVASLSNDIAMVELATDNQPAVEPAPEPPPIPRVNNDLPALEDNAEVAPLNPGVSSRIQPGTQQVRRLPEVLQLTANPTVPNDIDYPNTGFAVPPSLPKPNAVPQTQNQNEAAPAKPAPVKPCVRPVGLLSQLEELSQFDEARIVAQELLEEIQKLAQRGSLAEENVPRQLYRIEALTSQLEEMAEQAESLRLRSELKRTVYAVRRRLTIWERARQLLRSQHYTSIETPNVQRLKDAIAQSNKRISSSRFEERWRGYLGLVPIQALVNGDLTPESIGRLRALCAVALLRIESPMLDDAQRHLMSQREFVQLADALRPWAAQPIDIDKLLYHIESYEVRGGSNSGETVSQSYHWLRWSGRETDEEFARELNTHYRNANIRIAVSKELINRLLPNNEVYTEPVQDTILGARVRGHSTTSNNVGVNLYPDGSKWRMNVEATGQVASNTRSSRGPATFYNRGNATFHAQREVSVTPNGINLHPSRVGAYTGSDLHDVKTDFDSVPLIGMFARAIAVQQHDSQIHQADREMRGKVARRVQDKFDSEVQTRVNQASSQFRTKVFDPLYNLNVDPMAIDMKTTEQRIIARYRLASSSQLAANTPRPLAPSDSLISAQIHQSSMNNVLQNLDLDGKRMGLREIFEKVGGMFPSTQIEISQDLPDRVTVEFAKYDAIRVKCDDGMVTLTLKIQELQSGQQSWDKFIVRAHYRPDSHTLEANLVRQGYIELQGKRLRLVDQAALRGIFGKVFDKERKLPLISDHIAKHPKMRDSEMTQCVMQDGWIGIALGPKRPAIISSRTVIVK